MFQNKLLTWSIFVVVIIALVYGNAVAFFVVQNQALERDLKNFTKKGLAYADQYKEYFDKVHEKKGDFIDPIEVTQGIIENVHFSKKMKGDYSAQLTQTRKTYEEYLDTLKHVLDTSKTLYIGDLSLFKKKFTNYKVFFDSQSENISQINILLNLLEKDQRHLSGLLENKQRWYALIDLKGFLNLTEKASRFFPSRAVQNERGDRITEVLTRIQEEVTNDFLRGSSPEEIYALIEKYKPELADDMVIYHEIHNEEKKARQAYVWAEEAKWRKWGAVPPEAPYPHLYKQIYINLASQFMYAYEDGQLILSTPITSGKQGYETARGTHKIYSKTRGRYLRSPFVPEDDPEYYELWVDFWMPFSGGYGIHDACNSRDCWRTQYGGSDYNWAGSHGCVNTPYEAVAFLFDWAYVGTTVYVK